MAKLTGYPPLARLVGWQAGRPERRVLIVCSAALTLLCALLALTPASLVEAILSLLAPSTSSRSVVRNAVLDHHRLVFGLLGLGAAATALAAPALLRAVRFAADGLVRLDRRTFLLAVIAFVVASRMVALPRMQPIIPGHDTGHYFQLANTLLDEGRYIEYASHPGEPDGFRAWRLPGYPAALAVALAVSGRWPGSVVLLNAFWMVLLVLAIYGLARRLGSEVHARMAALAVALYPLLLTASLETMSEMQYTALLALSVYLLIGRRPSWWSVGLAGVAIGLAAMTRGNGLLMFGILLLAYPAWAYFARERKPAPPPRRLAARAALFALCFLITVAPWMARNRTVLGSWVALATSGGVNMWIGHHPGGDGLLRPGKFPPMPPGLDEVEMSRYGTSRSLAYWAERPLENAKIAVRIASVILKVDKGALPLVFPDGSPRAGEPGRALYLGLFALFMSLYAAVWALVGVWAAARVGNRWPPGVRLGPLVFIALVHVATFMPFLGYARYKIPSVPFLVAAAAMVAVTLALPTPAGSRGDDSPEAARPRTREGRGAAPAPAVAGDPRSL